MAAGRIPAPRPTSRSHRSIRLAYPFYVPFGTRTLASLIAGAYLPTIRMVNRTDSVPGNDRGNQDACRNATVNLSFVGAP